MTTTRGVDDDCTFAGDDYRLIVRDGAPVAWLEDASGARWAELRLLASVDTLDGPDETLAVSGPELARPGSPAALARLTWTLRSSRWRAKRLIVVAARDGVRVHAEVEGRGRVSDVRLLGGRAVLPRSGGGTLMSGAWFETLFSAGPADPGRIVKSARESAWIGVASGSEPGRGAWFFTPAPFSYAVSRARVADPLVVPPGPWLTIALETDAAHAGFGGFAWEAVDRGFDVRLDFDGKTRVDGEWRTPAVALSFAADPYEGIARHLRRLESARLATPAAAAPPATPAWWRQPLFCGWGEQCRMARLAGGTFAGAAGFATQANYEAFLAHLEARGIVPGTVSIDDKWHAAYGTCEADRTKWPDLRGWIDRRHERGQRVLLWWKAWDAEGLPAQWCVRSTAGDILGIDPTNAEAREGLRAAVRRMLGGGPGALNADGLKIDFTARTPSGVATVHRGPAWGVSLLAELLSVVADEARRVKPDALLVAHTPNALVAPFVDMIRLNDALRLDDPEPRVDVVAQMRYRAAVARAACPGHLVDADDWCMPDLATWRAYLAAKADLGVPALYYATGIDLSGEDFEPADYAAIARTWAAYRAREGLPEPQA